MTHSPVGLPFLAEANLLGGLLSLGFVGVVAFFAVACLAAFALFIRRVAGVGRANAFPYQIAGALFTPAEGAFLGVLARAAGPDLLVFGKVRIADLIQPRAGLPRQRFLQALNRVTSKHVDFVLVERASLLPRVAIELDDRSHLRADRQRRDAFVDGALAAVGLPLLRFPVQRGSTPLEVVCQRLAEVLPDYQPQGRYSRRPPSAGQPVAPLTHHTVNEGA